MTRYVARRILRLIPTAFIIVTLIFFLFRIVPGDPARSLVGTQATEEEYLQARRLLGLLDPIPVQYMKYLWGMLHGDLGKSFYSFQSVTKEVVSKYPVTMQLALASLLVSVPIGIAAGVISATRQYSIYDKLSMLFAIIGNCTPSFWIGLILMVIFSVRLRWLPVTGMGSIRHIILPAITLGLPSTAIIARMMRTGMLDVIREDYIRTARAKGLTERVVIMRHALKNALIPTVTVVGLQVGFLLGGSVVTESLFAWPGLGSLLIAAVRRRDYPMVQAAVLFFAFTFMLVNLLVDLLYAYIDPRIRYE